MDKMYRLFSVILAVTLMTPQVWGRTNSNVKRPFGSDEVDYRLSEYYYRKSYGSVLVPVKLLGDVKNPGLYHIPHSTSLTTLLSIAGGPNGSADEDVRVTSASRKSTEEIDINDIVKGERNYALTGGETIYIPREEGIFDHSSYTTIAAVAGIMSMVLTAILVSERLEDN